MFSLLLKDLNFLLLLFIILQWGIRGTTLHGKISMTYSFLDVSNLNLCLSIILEMDLKTYIPVYSTS